MLCRDIISTIFLLINYIFQCCLIFIYTHVHLHRVCLVCVFGHTFFVVTFSIKECHVIRVPTSAVLIRTFYLLSFTHDMTITASARSPCLFTRLTVHLRSLYRFLFLPRFHSLQYFAPFLCFFLPSLLSSLRMFFFCWHYLFVGLVPFRQIVTRAVGVADCSLHLAHSFLLFHSALHKTIKTIITCIFPLQSQLNIFFLFWFKLKFEKPVCESDELVYQNYFPLDHSLFVFLYFCAFSNCLVIFGYRFLSTTFSLRCNSSAAFFFCSALCRLTFVLFDRILFNARATFTWNSAQFFPKELPTDFNLNNAHFSLIH